MSVLEKQIPGDYLMLVGFVMIVLGWLIAQWGWIFGGVLFFLVGCTTFEQEGEKDGRGRQGEQLEPVKPPGPPS